MAEPLGGLTKGAAAKMGQVARQVLGRLPDVGRRTRRIQAGGGGGCETQNTIIDITVFGTPTGGTFDLVWTVNGTAEAITFDYNETTSNFATALATHSEFTSSDIDVSGGTLPDRTIRVEFIGDLANTNILPPVCDWTSLTGGSGRGVICAVTQRGHA